MKKIFFLFYLLAVFLVFIFSLAWEFWLEPVVEPIFNKNYRPETVADHWEYVITVLLFSIIALIIPFVLTLKIFKKSQSAFDSLKTLQLKTENLLQEKTVELASFRDVSFADEQFHAKLEEINETISISLQSLINSISDSIMVIDKNYQVRMLNKAARDIHFDGSQPEEIILCHKLSHNSDTPCSGPEHKCPFAMVLDSGESCTVLHHHLNSNGETVPFEILASPIRNEAGDIVGIIELARDVSDRLDREKKQREADTRLLNLQREQSIATLAGGLAHEFNNTLTTILGNAELLDARLGERNTSKKLSEAIISGSEHLADLTRQLLAYAKGGKYLNQSVLINAQIKDTIRLMQTEKFADTKITLNLTEDLWPVSGDPGHV